MEDTHRPTDAAGTVNTPKKSVVKKFFKKMLYYFLGLVLLVAVGFLLVCNYNYSEGNQSGVIMRFSREGFLFKTYEGEMNLGGMNSIPTTAQTNQSWRFSVKDKAIADTLMQLGGRKVMLHYQQKIKAMPWQGETNNFIDGVKLISE